MRKALLMLTCAAVIAASVGCEKKEKKAVSDTASETTAAFTETSTAATTAEATTAEADTTVPEAAAAEEPATKAAGDDSKYTESMDIARDFYKAYINKDAAAVYDMFSKEEMEAYYKVIAPTLDGKAPNEVFKRSVVEKAISDSMKAVGDIMQSYADTENDKWSVLISEENIRDISQDDLDGFNKDYGTSFKSAVQCRYMFYQDDTNGQAFTGNTASFLEKDGKWYLSFSQLIQSDLYQYIYME